jgi:hypothetical protein
MNDRTLLGAVLALVAAVAPAVAQAPAADPPAAAPRFAALAVGAGADSTKPTAATRAPAPSSARPRWSSPARRRPRR